MIKFRQQSRRSCSWVDTPPRIASDPSSAQRIHSSANRRFALIKCLLNDKIPGKKLEILNIENERAEIVSDVKNVSINSKYYMCMNKNYQWSSVVARSKREIDRRASEKKKISWMKFVKHIFSSVLMNDRIHFTSSWNIKTLHSRINKRGRERSFFSFSDLLIKCDHPLAHPPSSAWFMSRAFDIAWLRTLIDIKHFITQLPKQHIFCTSRRTVIDFTIEIESKFFPRNSQFES